MKLATALCLLLAALPASARRADPVEDGFKRADGLLEKGRYADTRDALDEVLGGLAPQDPRLVRYHERVGATWLREGRINEARASFTSALTQARRLKASGDAVARAYAGLGLCLRSENNDKYALRFFKKALAYKPDEGTRMFVEDQIREIEGAPPLPAP